MNRAPARPGEEDQQANYRVSSRKMIALGSDVQVREFNLAADEEIPWHRHTQVFDVFYCLEGRLDIELADIASGERLQPLTLNAGESARVEAGTAHRPHNRGPGVCRFLLVQGVGQYDYIPHKPGKSQGAQ